VLAIIEAAGWPIWFLILASVIALAIILERLWSLRAAVVAPPCLLDETLDTWRRQGADDGLIRRMASGAPLARVLAAGLRNAEQPREIMKDAIEEAGRGVSPELDRFLTTLGTIAAMAPLLGLLGTVFGMIEIFAAQGPAGENPMQLAHGISIALYNTAFGLIVAIPSMIFYRHFRARSDQLLLDMEQQALRLVEVVHAEPR